jgi:hypothetical protein
MIDLGTGNNNKINWAMNDKQEFIDIVETVFRGARKGRGLVVSPKGGWRRPAALLCVVLAGKGPGVGWEVEQRPCYACNEQEGMGSGHPPAVHLQSSARPALIGCHASSYNMRVSCSLCHASGALLAVPTAWEEGPKSPTVLFLYRICHICALPRHTLMLPSFIAVLTWLCSRRLLHQVPVLSAWLPIGGFGRGCSVAAVVLTGSLTNLTRGHFPHCMIAAQELTATYLYFMFVLTCLQLYLPPLCYISSWFKLTLNVPTPLHLHSRSEF